MTLQWFKLYGDLPEHPKSDLLEIELATERAWTFVVQLWCWASRVRPEGDLSGIPAEIVARRAGWKGDAHAFVDALRRVGFMQGDTLAGWQEEQGAFLRKRERDAESAKRRRDATKKPQRKAAKAESQNVGATSRDASDDTGAESAPSRVAEKKRKEEIRREEKREDHSPDPERASAVSIPVPTEPPNREPLRAVGRFRGRGVIGLHEQALAPKTPEELDARLELAKRFPAFDGADGRPVRLEVVRGQWPSFVRKLETSGLDAALADFPGWLSNRYDKAFASWERRGGGSSNGGQHARSGEYRELRADPERDPPPFEDFCRRRDAGETVDQICPRRATSARRTRDAGETVAPTPRIVAAAFDHEANAPPEDVLAGLRAAAGLRDRTAYAPAEDWAEIDRALGDMGGAE